VSSAAQLGGSNTASLNLAGNGRLNFTQPLTIPKPLNVTTGTGYVDTADDTQFSSTTTLSPGTTLVTSVPLGKTATFSDLAGSGGLFRLEGGGDVLATGSSPNIDVPNGTFIVNSGNYGGGGAVDVTVGNLGILQINNGASINLNSVILSFGDGSVGGSGTLTSGWIDNTLNAAPVALPATISTINDGTFTIADAQLVNNNTTWRLVGGPYTGGTTLFPTADMTLGGMVSWTLVRNSNELLMKISGNSLLPALNTTGSLVFSSTREIADQIVSQSFSGGKDYIQGVMPDKESFRSFARALSSFSNRLKSYMGSYRPSSSGGDMNEKSIHELESSLDRPKIRLKTDDDSHSLWLGGLYTRGYNKKTNFSSESHDVQEGLLVGSEWNHEKKRRFMGLTLGFTLGEQAVSSQKLNNSKSKTAFVGGYFSQGFLTSSEW
jgi:hypothetical protein